MSFGISKLEVHIGLNYKEEIVSASVSLVSEIIQANLLPDFMW